MGAEKVQRDPSKAINVRSTIVNKSLGRMFEDFSGYLFLSSKEKILDLNFLKGHFIRSPEK